MKQKDRENLIQDLRKDDLTVALAESMTAGLLANEFAKIKDSYGVFRGSLVVYQPIAKKMLLDISNDLMDKYSCESQEVTTELAKGVKTKLQPEIAVAVTGLASPGGSESEEKPVGTVFFSIIFKDDIYEFKKEFGFDDNKDIGEEKDRIMRQTCDFIFSKIKEIYNERKENV